MRKISIKYLASLLALVLITLFLGQALAADQAGTSEGKYLGQGNYAGSYWPTEGWKTCKPEEVGMNSGKLAPAIAYAASPEFKTDGLVIIRKGYIVGEAYFGNFGMNSRHTSASMAKSFTSALIGIAIDKGLLQGIDEKLCKYYPEWDCNKQSDPRSRITIRHAMTLTTGLEWYEDWSKFDKTTNDALKMGDSGHFIKYMSERKSRYEPGKRFFYSTGDPMLLSRVIQQVTGMNAFQYARQNLFKPLNITNVGWEADQDGYTATAWGLNATVRDYAKFGYLYLNKGRWEDKQIVPEAWVEKSTKTDPSVAGWEAYGLLWHVNLPLRLRWVKSPISRDSIPVDGFMADGILGQNIFIIPSKDLVIVRVANQTTTAMDVVKFLTTILSAIEK